MSTRQIVTDFGVLEMQVPDLTLRDYFAGQVLVLFNSEDCRAWTNKKLAMHCYELADAMLKERSKTTT